MIRLATLLAVAVFLSGCAAPVPPLTDREAATFFNWGTCAGHQYDCLTLE